MPRTDQSPRRSSRSRRSRRSPRRRGRIIGWSIGGFLLLAVAAVAVAAFWVGSRALEARDELTDALPLASTVKDQILAKDTAGAQTTVDTMKGHVGRAQELTSDPVWRLSEAVPVLGPNLAAIRTLASSTNTVVTDAVEPLIGVANALDPTSLKPVDGRIDTAPIVAAAPTLTRVSGVLTAVGTEIRGLDTSGTLSPVTDAVSRFEKLLGETTPTIDAIAHVTSLAPGVLGVDGPRTYLVLFQNSAEARALGGIVGSSAIVSVDNGSISLVKQAQAAATGDFQFSYPVPVVDVPADVQEIYQGAWGTNIQDSTITPSFTRAATAARAFWDQKLGIPTDGVISLDPVAISYLLAATGPIALPSGDQLTSENAVSLLLSDVYARYPDPGREDRALQDAFFQSSVEAVFQAVASGQADPTALIDSVTKAWGERRLLFWSSVEAEQTEIVAAGANGEMPVSDASVDRVGVYFSDAIAGKMDYYLQPAVQLSQATCPADGLQHSRVTVDLTNLVTDELADELPDYVTGGFGRERVTIGDIRLNTFFYAPVGSTVTGATVDGVAVDVGELHDGDYPVVKVQTQFAPQATSTITLDFVSAAPQQKTLEAQVTPTIHPSTVTATPLDCATIE